MIDNEAGREREWSLNYIEDWVADKLQSVASAGGGS
jgi:hypothetical protein